MKTITVSSRSISILRVMLSGIFIIAGFNHVVFSDGVVMRLTASPAYVNYLSFLNATPLVIATGAGLLTGGILLLINKFTRYAAIGLLGLLIAITLSVQLQGWETSGPLFKNVAIAGGLIFFIINDFKKINDEVYEA